MSSSFVGCEKTAVGPVPNTGGTLSLPTLGRTRMEALRRAVRDRADRVGATCAVFISVRLNGDARGTGAIACVPAADLALACRCRQGGGRELPDERVGGQYTDDSGGHSTDSQRFA
jgi:hypothetical protein